MKLSILSRGPKLYSTRRLVEAANHRGHEVSIVNHSHCYCVAAQGGSKIFCGDEAVTADAIIPRIGASITSHGASIVRQFEMLGTVTSTSSISLVRSRDKLRSLQILSKDQGVEIPRTAFAKHPDNIKYLIKQVGGTPLIIKILEGTQGLGVVLAETISAAKSVLEAFYNVKVNILLQEFIQEAAGTDIRVLVVGGKVVGAMKRTNKSGDFRSNLHRGGVGESVEITDGEVSTAVKAAKLLGLGVAGVDIIRSERGPLVIEVNSSPGLEGIEKVTGNDIASEIVQYIEKKVSINDEKDEVGA